jgi:hypothetical protein
MYLMLRGRVVVGLLLVDDLWNTPHRSIGYEVNANMPTVGIEVMKSWVV